MNLKLSFTRLLLFACLSLPFAGALSAPGSDTYRQGVIAFKNGDYRVALEKFENAKSAGDTSPNLLYNLAVTHYKLGNYGQAEALFAQLAKKPDWEYLARYNLGLTLEKRGTRAEAVNQYQKVVRESDQSRLRYLARKRLEALAAPVPERAQRDWAALLSLAGGTDDNVIAFPEQLQQDPSQGEDNFTELLAYGHAYLAGVPGNGMRLYGTLYRRAYSELDFLNVDMFSAGLLFDQPLGAWELEYGANFISTRIDGEALTTETQLQLGLSRDVRGHEYQLRYRYGAVSAGDLYPQLEGSVQRFEASWQRRTSDWHVRARYRLEINDRDDLNTGSEFFSYSPTRQAVELIADRWFTPRWAAGIGLGFASSSYPDANTLTDVDGQTKTAKRETDQTEYWLRTHYDLTDSWRAGAEYRRTDQSDNFELYTYERSVLKLSLEYLF